LLEHAGGFLAARNAQVEPFFFFQKDRVGIIFAVVAALAAILLAHGGHHAPAQRPPLRKLHALIELNGLVVPWRLAVVTVVERPLCDRRRRRTRHQRRGFFRRQRRYAAVEREEAGEEAIEPFALLGRKRRVLRNEGRERRARREAHAASTATSALSASRSW